MRINACPRISEYRLIGGINYGEYRYAGLNSYNLQLVGTNKVDKNSFIHWKKNI